MEDLNLVMRERLQKAQELEQAGVPLFPNGYPVTHQIEQIIVEHGGKSAEELEHDPPAFLLAGRILAIRTFGKSIFMHLLDAGGKLQIYLQQNQVGQDAYALAKKLDIGDIIRVSGALFRTRTQELTLLVKEVVLLTKNLRPLSSWSDGTAESTGQYRRWLRRRAIM
jgi:lysyl-tRNA synthetase class 2